MRKLIFDAIINFFITHLAFTMKYTILTATLSIKRNIITFRNRWHLISCLFLCENNSHMILVLYQK